MKSDQLNVIFDRPVVIDHLLFVQCVSVRITEVEQPHSFNCSQNKSTSRLQISEFMTARPPRSIHLIRAERRSVAGSLGQPHTEHTDATTHTYIHTVCRRTEPELPVENR